MTKMLRSDFLKETAAAIAAGAATPMPERSDYTIRIGRAAVELAPGRTVTTTTYNGAFPGPLLRLRAGRPIVVDLINETATPEQLHWHGQHVPPYVDGAAEERTPYIPARGSRRIRFTPGPPGLRFYHTHLRAGADLSMGQYSGQVGPVYIEPQRDPGAYDREVFLVLKEFEPTLMHGGDMAQTFLQPATRAKELQSRGEAAMQRSLSAGMPKGYEVGYRLFSINGRMLGHGEPIRVRRGERVLLHVLNGSATEIRSLALPHHSFTVVALDGNPVPTPVRVPVLWVGTAERVDAIVEMNAPGVWVLGDTDTGDRSNGMGIVLEYAGSSGAAQWSTPPASAWDYTRFGLAQAAAEPDETFTMLIEKRNAAERGFNIWTINGAPYAGGATLAMSGQMDDLKPVYHLREGRRYRLRMRNATDDIHPVHLHRHTFELTRVAGETTSGVLKDVAMLGGYQELEMDFVADDPGLTLFHCHQQLHMDFGFMALFDYV
jgi:FtsP/CotA-like multicopper oxidase with cupredoxin domain